MSWQDILKSVYRMTHTGSIYTLKETQVRNGITIYILEDEESVEKFSENLVNKIKNFLQT